jgi:hypothetical protein
VEFFLVKGGDEYSSSFHGCEGEDFGGAEEAVGEG